MCCSVGTTDERDFIIKLLRWPQVARYKMSPVWFKQSGNNINNSFIIYIVGTGDDTD